MTTEHAERPHTQPRPLRPRRPWKWPVLARERQGLGYGGDYNPEQWSEEVWDEDIRLMQEARVNTVALGIFSWAKIQPAEDTWDFSWLDTIIAKLGAAGISVDLATATATAPQWLYLAHPEVLPKDKYGHVIHPGARQSWSASSPVFRAYALELTRRLAERYGTNPHVIAWHVGNEYGWNNRHDYSDNALAAFRVWCENRYETIEALNAAWGTSFWGQNLASFDQILLPYHMGADAMVNPAMKLDFERFGNDALLDFYRAERDEIARVCPDKPCTTNFMVSTDQCCMDYAGWAREVDFVSNDHYFQDGPAHLDELACSDALMASLAAGRPWYVMEHSTSAVQWKPLNARKRGGELIRDGLAHVAFGADAVNFFQWRASRFGAEAFHSAMLPHAGADTKVFRGVCELGRALEALSEVQGSVVERSSTAILFSADAQWATESETLPTRELDHWHDVRDWYYAFLNAGVRADVVPLSSDWSEYETVVVPTLLVVSEADAQRIRSFPGRVVVGYASGLMDEHMQVGLGGYPAAFRDMLGVRGEEFNILGSERIELDNGMSTGLWQNDIRVSEDVQVLARYRGERARYWELEGTPALTKRENAYFVGCDLSVAAKTTFIEEELGSGSERDVLHTRRVGARTYDFYFARGQQDVQLSGVSGTVLYALHAQTGKEDGTYTLGADGLLVVAR